MLLIIGIDLRLDVARHLRFIGKLHGFEEVRIDVGEIHLAEVEARAFVDRETGALSFLGLPPRLVDLRPPLLLHDPRPLRFKATIGLPLRLADAEEARRTIAPDRDPKTEAILYVQLLFFIRPKERSETLGDRQRAVG